MTLGAAIWEEEESRVEYGEEGGGASGDEEDGDGDESSLGLRRFFPSPFLPEMMISLCDLHVCLG